MEPSCEFDVAVVGAGPGGSAAAKSCAEYGMKTILLEKRQLPRSKVCTGMIMSEMAQALVAQTFGNPPEEVLTRPPYLKGLTFQARGVTTLTLEHRMPFTWRSDFDFWLNQTAKKTGVELWDRTRVTSVVEQDGVYILNLDKDGESKWLKTKFLIGADGTFSVIRKMLFPKIPMRYQLNLRMCYRGALDLDPEYVHYFYFTDLSGFEVNFKEDIFLLEITPRSNQRDGAEIVQKAEEWLAQQYGFLPGSLPLWRDGCYEPAMSRPPFSEPFPLAKGNVLLVGNAVGLNIPMTGEGIGTAVKSGLLAAEALHKAKDKKRKAADFYPGLCREMLATINGMYPPPGAIRDSLNRGMDGFLEAIKEIYSNSMAVL